MVAVARGVEGVPVEMEELCMALLRRKAVDRPSEREILERLGGVGRRADVDEHGGPAVGEVLREQVVPLLGCAGAEQLLAELAVVAVSGEIGSRHRARRDMRRPTEKRA